MKEQKFYINLVTYNNSRTIRSCIDSILRQDYKNYELSVIDNNSLDETVKFLSDYKQLGIIKNSSNYGFSAAHNQGVKNFIETESDVFIVLNPDLALSPNFLRELNEVLERNSEIGIVTPKLYRADSSLKPVEPNTLDAAGMILTRDLRHFDRGSNEIDIGRYNEPELIFGATGACLILRRSAIEKLLLPRIEDHVLFKIYPELEPGAKNRPQLFDEGFFAYREDADLSWRAKNLGLKCLYAPNLIAYHERVVLPERRSKLDPKINSISVRNRFLLQVNNYSLKEGLTSLIFGIIVRNIVVVLGVLFLERSSIQGLKEFLILFKRAWKIREYNKR